MVRFLRLLLVCAAAYAGSDAERFFKAGERAEKAGDVLNAYLLYSRASTLEPRNYQYLARKNALKTITALSARQELAPDPADPDSKKKDPLQETDFNATERMEARDAVPPPRLKGSGQKKSFDLKGDPRTIFEKVAEAYGISVVFESDYQPPPQFRFQLADASMEDAFRVLETVSASFFVPVNEKMALVVRDTPQKRTERSPAMSVAIPIPERMSVQDAQELLTAVQQTLDIRRVSVDPTRHMVFLRDQATKAEAARRLFYTLSKIRPQIAVDVQFLSVEKNSSLNYGMQLPNEFSIVNFQGLTSLPNALRTVARLTGSSTPLALGITQASVFATLARSRSDNLLEAQIVSLDGQAATLHVGQRYPIITNGYYGDTTGTGQVYAPPPTVNFEDLGFVLKITPWIHDDDEVTLDIDTEFKVLGAQSAISGIPIIGSRKFTGKVRLKDGEWAVLAGLVQATDAVTKTGIPGLSEIPFFGKFFSQNDVEKASSEILLIFKPHLTTMPAWETVPPPIWVGTQTRPLTVY
ncbi:MAG: type II and III secretion system protein [Acidobacteriia bacterium]|nr:type II and III secretion system protein [Terriglobia bacterium]